MIGCKLYGGLGNQLFIISHTFAFSKKYNIDYFVPTNVIQPHVSGKKSYRFTGIKYLDNPPELQLWKEPHFHYADIPPVDNVCFDGCFQSWKYFNEYREDLLNAFGLKWEMNSGVVSLHYRCGDYKIQQDYHPVVSEKYIEDSVYYFAKRGYYNFLVLSDEIEIVKKIITHPGRFPSMFKFEYTHGDEVEDLVKASQCEHNIGSNSSYSWWIHYLNRNKNKQGVFPEKWFGPLLNHDTKDLLLPESIVL